MKLFFSNVFNSKKRTNSDQSILNMIEVPFDNRDPLYECCCGYFHVKCGGISISVFITVISIAQLIAVVLAPVLSVGITVLMCAYYTLWIFSGVFIMIGVLRVQPRLLLFPVFLNIISLVFVAFLYFLCVLMACFPKHIGIPVVTFLLGVDTADSLVAVEIEIVVLLFGSMCLCAFWFVTFLILLWTLRIVFQCYGYLLDVEEVRENGPIRPTRLKSRPPSGSCAASRVPSLKST